LFSNKDQGIISRPKIAEQTGKNTLVIYGELRGKQKLGLVSFE